MFFKKFKPPSTQETKDFYDKLMSGEVKRTLWGKESRFDSLQMSKKPSVLKFFLPTIKENIGPDDTVLDIGCGSGGFTFAAAPYCKEIVGLDISKEFINEANRILNRADISNVSFHCYDGDTPPSVSEKFDVVLMVDVIHHMSDPDELLEKI